MTLEELIQPFSQFKVFGDRTIEITGLHYDSRKIKPGMMFVAVSGFRQDGKLFIPDALKNGASAVLTDTEIKLEVPVIVSGSIRKAMSDIAARFYHHPGNKLQIFGVTGTNGKSTSVYLIRKIVEQTGCRVGMINSLVYDTFVKQYKAERTTPDSIEMQKYLAEMVEAGCKCAVIEVSSHALVLNRVDNIKFKLGLFTNFSRDHLDFHKTMDNYLEAKKMLLVRIAHKDGLLVINKDVPEFASIAKEFNGEIVSYSASGQEADLMCESAELTADGTIFKLRTSSGSCKVHYRLPGRYNMENALGAAAAGLAFSIDLNSIKNALESAQPVPGRFQPVRCGQPFSIVIDFAHTPDALARLCLSAKEITNGRILTLFGCGGDRDRGKRPLMAEAASKNSDFVILTSDNPRTENPDRIFEDTIPGMVGNEYLVISDRREAIAAIINKAEKGDSILIAGKGAEDYQEIGTTKYPFSDETEILKALEALGYNQVKTG